MCKQTRTKDHTICDIELGNNPNGFVAPSFNAEWTSYVNVSANIDQVLTAAVEKRNYNKAQSITSNLTASLGS